MYLAAHYAVYTRSGVPDSIVRVRRDGPQSGLRPVQSSLCRVARKYNSQTQW